MGELWLRERLSESIEMRFHATRELMRMRSPFQEISVFDTASFGRLLRLDDCNMTSTFDEHIYHEAMTHPALLAQNSPSRALILGGGDGGAARQILRYPTIQCVLIAELDAQVIEVSKSYLPSVCLGVFDSPRVQVVIGDAMNFLSSTAETFDLVVMDLTDPNANASALYSESALRLMRSRLTEQGCLSTHVGSAHFHAPRCASLLSRLRRVFAHVVSFERYVPIYGVPWTMTISSERLLPIAIDEIAMKATLAFRAL